MRNDQGNFRGVRSYGFHVIFVRDAIHIMDHKVKCIWGAVGVVMAIPQLFGGVFLDDKATHIWTMYVEFFV